ncbi:MAG: excinuclease ABC subunit UvrA [Chloroflexi bacterium]|nr:excinuclease ABC subunit UvrA [Chloroflexota bacterium]MCL5076149.1 excinuclease ABC subunit UvrA [Chloroflexota bacterium]
MPQDKIIVHGAREHNLKNIDVVIPRDKFVVITGLSGSGKSSLAFDTIYAEGQRRYVESLSAYARQFLGQMEKPDVDYIEGLSPAISIDQKGVSHNPRSTVGTVTETYDYLRLLFARVGHPHCPKCGREISQQTVQQIVDTILGLSEGSRIMIMAPLVRDRKGEHQQVLEDVRKSGYVRVRIDGRIYDISEEIEMDKNKKHTIDVVVDRLVIRKTAEDENGRGVNPDTGRLADSVETALKLGGGVVLISIIDGPELLFSEHFACVHCGISLGEIAPRTFSFNSPHGACRTCTGLGITMEIDPELVIPNKELTLAEGAIQPWSRASANNTYFAHMLGAVARHYGFSMHVPAKNLSQEQLNILLYGSRGTTIRLRHENRYGRMHEYETTFEGVIPNLERRYRETDSDYIRSEIERYMSGRPCPACNGARLKPESLAVTIAGKSIVDVTRLSVTEAMRWFETLEPQLSERERLIAKQVIKEIRARLGFLLDVGLEYLTIDRAAGTLSGGEAQRIRLATQIGSSLMGVLYILDEPSIGLHQRDNRRLINTLKRLRDIGNTVLVIEHDEETIRSSDYIIDIGPGAGEHGGEVVAAGTLQDIMNCPRSITGQYLRGERKIAVPPRRRSGNGKKLIIKGAREHNLKNVDVHIPLGKFVCVTGVSGSGKSTLVDDILYKRLAQILYRARDKPGDHDGVIGLENLDKVVNIDQSPIGRTPRSNPATYTGVFTPIRELFAAVPEARMRGYQPGRFSFNVKGGRCEACQGEGIIQIEMQFLPDVYVPCEVCKGKRYNREALEIRYKGKSIADVLEMTVDEALKSFEHIPVIQNKLATLSNVGLGYIRLGQPATTLSGGEAQRVKLSTELSRRATGRTLYILDEPTTGLHFADVEKLLQVLERLVDAGNSVLVIEHNLDVIKTADWIIDLGPEGGEAGGWVIAEGTPEEVAAMPHSYTGQFLRRLLPERELITKTA